MKLMDGFDSNYRYILVAARRARQLQGRSDAQAKETEQHAAELWGRRALVGTTRSKQAR